MTDLMKADDKIIRLRDGVISSITETGLGQR